MSSTERKLGPTNSGKKAEPKPITNPKIEASPTLMNQFGFGGRSGGTRFLRISIIRSGI